MKQFAGFPNRGNIARNNGTFIEMTNNQEVLYNELQKRKGRSSP